MSRPYLYFSPTTYDTDGNWDTISRDTHYNDLIINTKNIGGSCFEVEGRTTATAYFKTFNYKSADDAAAIINSYSNLPSLNEFVNQDSLPTGCIVTGVAAFLNQECLINAGAASPNLRAALSTADNFNNIVQELDQSWVPSSSNPNIEYIYLSDLDANLNQTVNWLESLRIVYQCQGNRTFQYNTANAIYEIALIAKFVLPVTASCLGGSADITSQNYYYEDNVTFYFTPSAEYDVNRFDVSSAGSPQNLISTVEGNRLKVTFNPQNATSISVTFGLKQYTLAFEGAGTQIIEYGQTPNKDSFPSIPNKNQTYEKYFIGKNWESADGDGPVYKDRYYYAIYDEYDREYTITIINNNSTSNFLKKEKCSYGESVTLIAEPDFGYSFLGWTRKKADNSLTNILSQNFSYSANVIESSIGGILDNENVSEIIFYINTKLISYIVSFGYEGFTTGEKLPNQTLECTVAENLTANTLRKIYTINFNSNDGLNGDAVLETSNLTSEALFEGWIDNGDIIGPDGKVYGRNRTGNYKFDAAFYANNNEDIKANIGYDKYLLLKHYLEIGKAEGRAGYSEENPGLYEDQALVKNLSMTEGYVVPLDIQWKEHETIILPNITRVGYNFLGWYDDIDDGNRVGGIYTPYLPNKNNITLYAYWEKITTSSIIVSTEENANSIITFEAQPYSENIFFSHWSDGNTDNPRSLALSSNVSLIAYFFPKQVLDVKSNFDYAGSVEIIGYESNYIIAERGKEIILKLYPKEGYEFSHWSDGGINSSLNTRRYLIGPENQQLIAYFKPKDYTVYYQKNNFTDLFSFIGKIYFENKPITKIYYEDKLIKEV